jgi:hypothetical protein
MLDRRAHALASDETLTHVRGLGRPGDCDRWLASRLLLRHALSAATSNKV